MSWPKTPAIPGRVRQLAEQGTALEAVLAAWNDPGTSPGWHAMCQRAVRDEMPVLAAALDRLTSEEKR